MPKTYIGELVFGKTTPSIDLETEFNGEYPISHISEVMIKESVLSHFIGEIKQVPPIYSAIKLDGKRLYNYARSGVDESTLGIKSREAIIYDFEVNTINFPLVSFKITCSKGTYIRSLVRDLALALNSGAYLNKLTRTHIGTYSLAEAQDIKNFDQSIYEEIF
jgi:tRNA pseudouridine55 synthase